MKTFILIIALIAIASSLCPGYSPDNGKTCLGNNIGGCLTYKEPTIADGYQCSICHPAFTLKDGDCETNEFLIFTAVPPDDSYITFTNQYQAVLYGYLSDFNYSMMSCAIEGQVVPYCMDGYYLADDFKCTTCGIAGCVTCNSVDSVVKCTVCDANYVLNAEGTTCTKCSDNALTCEDSTKAATCEESYILNDSKQCVSCGTGIKTCTVVNTAVTCQPGYYKSTTTCTPCTDPINECTKPSDTEVATNCDYISINSSNAAYFIDGKCVSKARSEYCKTIVANTAANGYICGTCISGSYLSEGVCLACTAFVSTGDIDDCNVATVTPGDEDTAATFTCAAGWYHATTTIGTADTCNPCPTGCSACSITEGDAEVTCSTRTVATQAKYYLDAKSILRTCAEAGYKTQDAAANSKLILANALCDTCSVDLTLASNNITCLTCSETKELLYTDTGAITWNTAADPSFACVDTDDTQLVNCLYYKRNADDDILCLQCDPASYALKIAYASYTAPNFSGAETRTCETIDTTPANAAYKCLGFNYYDTTTDVYACTSCVSGYVLNSTTLKCITVANCITYNSTNSLCTACTELTHIINSTGLVCHTKDVNNCATYKPASATKECTACTAGHYLASTTSCSSSITDCDIIDPAMTITKSCLACKQGYKWKDGACALCSAENVCVKSGCESLDYPGMPDPTTPPAANQVIIMFIMSVFIALMTLLI